MTLIYMYKNIFLALVEQIKSRRLHNYSYFHNTLTHTFSLMDGFNEVDVLPKPTSEQ